MGYPRPIAAQPEKKPLKSRLTARIAAWLAEADEQAKASGKRRVLIYLARVLFQVTRQWMRDRGPQNAAFLAFWSVLSVVPILGLTLQVLRLTGATGAESRFVEFLSRDLVPVSQKEISSQLLAWSKNVSIESLGLVGLGATAVIALVLYVHFEKTVNYIWRVDRRRPLWRKVAVFVVLVTAVPPLLGLSLVQAARVGLTTGAAGVVVSVATTLATMFLVNYLVPRVRVHWGAALAAAVLTTVLLEVAKFGFRFYVTEIALERFTGVYGAVAVLPLWLFWVYWSWLVILLGIEVAHTAQNLRFLENVDRQHGLSNADEVLRRINPLVAIRLLVAIAGNRDKVAPSVFALAREFALPEEVVERVTQVLLRAGFISQTSGATEGLALSRPASEIQLDDVLEVFRIDVPSSRHAQSQVKTNEALAQLTPTIDSKTLGDLL